MTSPQRCSRPCQLLLTLGILFISQSAFAFESPSYEVLEKDGKFEIRRYETFHVATITVQSEAEAAGDRAFPALAGYISGDNSQDQKISMTTPVYQEVAEGSQVISFMMPTKWSLDTLPKPSDSGITLTDIPARLIASYRYSGNWKLDRFKKYEAQLRARLAESSYKTCSGPLWARYNPPFWPTFMRRNEVQFVVSATDCPD